MKPKIKVFILLTSLMFVSNVTSNPAHWSRYIKTKSQDNVTISFRQRHNNRAWSIEWHVKNDSEEKIEPILVSRHYTCNNGESLELYQQSLGVYLPGDHRKGGIKDKGVCPNSTIKYVEIQSEILTLTIDETTGISQP